MKWSKIASLYICRDSKCIYISTGKGTKKDEFVCSSYTQWQCPMAQITSGSLSLIPSRRYCSLVRSTDAALTWAMSNTSTHVPILGYKRPVLPFAHSLEPLIMICNISLMTDITTWLAYGRSFDNTNKQDNKHIPKVSQLPWMKPQLFWSLVACK